MCDGFEGNVVKTKIINYLYKLKSTKLFCKRERFCGNEFKRNL